MRVCDSKRHIVAIPPKTSIAKQGDIPSGVQFSRPAVTCRTVGQVYFLTFVKMDFVTFLQTVAYCYNYAVAYFYSKK